jgi:hypothetical protein
MTPAKMREPRGIAVLAPSTIANPTGNFVRPAVSLASLQRQTPLYETLDGTDEIAIAVPGDANTE